MIKLLCVLFVFISLTAFVSAEELNFGESIDQSSLIEVSTLLSTPVQYLNKQVTVKGMIVGVCTKRGCWVDLASDTKFEKLRIKVRDGDMVFPLTAKGRDALATGVLKEIQLNLDQTRRYKAHLAKRQNEKIDVQSITEPMAIYQLSPVGVKILD